MNPTTAREKNKIFLTSKGRQVAPKMGVWALSPRQQNEGKDLMFQLKMLRELLSNFRQWRALPDVERVLLSGFVAIPHDTDGGGKCYLRFDPEDARWLAEIGAEINIEVVYIPE